MDLSAFDGQVDAAEDLFAFDRDAQAAGFKNGCLVAHLFSLLPAIRPRVR